jgi:hypothetical protein
MRGFRFFTFWFTESRKSGNDRQLFTNPTEELLVTSSPGAKAIVFAQIAVSLFVSVFATAQNNSSPTPAPILNAKKVFVANGGADALISSHWQGKGTPDRFYTVFYSAMSTWAHYELTASPADADLVFEVYAAAPLVSVNNGKARLQPVLQVTIIDAKSHFLLWRLTESLDSSGPGFFGGVEGSIKDSEFNNGAAAMISQMKSLTKASQ